MFSGDGLAGGGVCRYLAALKVGRCTTGSKLPVAPREAPMIESLKKLRSEPTTDEAESRRLFDSLPTSANLPDTDWN